MWYPFKIPWCFWTVVLEKILVPWTARRSNQSILKEFTPDYSLEGLMLKLKLPYFGHKIQRANSLEKIEGRRRERQRMRWLVASPTQWTWVWASSGRWWRTGKPSSGVYWGLQRVRHNWATERKEEKAIQAVLKSSFRLSLSLIVKKRIVKIYASSTGAP